MQSTEHADQYSKRVAVAAKARRWIPWLFFSIVTLGGFAILGGMIGYQQAWTEHQHKVAIASAAAVVEQYQLALQDLHEGNFDLARQRFEYVLNKDASFPGADSGLQTALYVDLATTTPTIVPPTITPTPTRDLRPIGEMLAAIQKLFSDGDWTGTIDVITALRNEDITYEAILLDGLLYQALRNRGLKKIQYESNLQGGIYDLSLSENFGPLDVEAQSWRNLARLYMIGSSFWEVYPQRAAEYFAEVAAAAPGLRDASGWTAFERYWVSLMQYGDQLALAADWCAAYAQYQLALSVRQDAQLQATQYYSGQQCFTPTASPAPIMTLTATPTLMITDIVITLTPTDAIIFTPTASPMSTVVTETPTLTPSATPTLPESPTETSNPGGSPSETPTPTLPLAP